MAKMMAKTMILQKGERDYINGVVQAIMDCDVSNEHWLLDYDGVLEYTACKAIDAALEAQINSGKIKARCYFGEFLIRNFHYKAGGTDDLSRQWAKKAVKAVILHGKKTALATYGR
ncbi:hypothetical protein FAY30_24265 [Bacillus sp. S3]|uniref:hypothetical protein n=1 Tax=Bacillus sp. S3 TaxID=486398 RepID=UPI00118CB769|nr:hypothetical protein [Bacillus sp. S3]QCJ44745.1 hypothetical protein FAY30_24265 [Bacillus sp. S3]